MNKKRFRPLAVVGALLSCALLAASSVQAAPSKGLCDPPREPGKKARGVRISVHSYFVVTNSEDGVRDRDVEVYGYLNINDQRIWAVRKKNRIENCVPYRRISAGWYDYEVMFDKPGGWALKLNGYVNDYDAGSDDDAMWNPGNIPRFANIKEMYETQQRNQHAEMTIRGDRKSESADLVLELGESKLIY